LRFDLKLAPADPRALSVGLVDRLLTLDARVHELERECASLRRTAGAPAAPSNAAAFDVPRTVHEWKLAEDERAAPEALWLYDIRVDDPVVLEGRRGAAFMECFGLLGESPDYEGALAALNAAAPAIPAMPDVSIVIPVYGQLAYTLNAIDSLQRHRSKYSFEIIIVDDRSPDESPLFLPLAAGIIYHAQPLNGGFIKSCNTGAGLARGQFMVMLNNDTRVVDGWLDALIGSFARWPNAGLVGSKLHYPDGSLQEAGGIIWRDGTAWNYGRGDDPNRPQYSHARQVDYISGCSIALPADLWRELGGFDSHFHPAYCEDADLALRVRAAGREVWYQPQSRIVHYEGKTSGTDTGGGAKAYQIVNTKKLYLRWHERLARHRPNAQAPYFERERDVHRHILVVDASAPTPDQDAGSVQTFMVLQTCLALGYKTHFVPQDNWLFQPKYTTPLQEMGVDCAHAPYEVGFEAYMRRYGWQFDAVLVFRPSVLEKCMEAIRLHAPRAAMLFHVADLHYLRMERDAQLRGDAALLEDAAAMRARELALIEAADCTITHSSIEQEILAGVAPGRPVSLWPLMAQHHGTKIPFGPRKNICFLGGYRHPPNIDAVQYFVAEIMPLLRLAEPGLHFIIAGSNMPAELTALAAPDVIIAGQVEDLRDLFDSVRVFACPLRVGAGVKGKVASAMAYGLPVVSTPIGVEGTALRHGHDVLVAETPADFAAQILAAYRDEALWHLLSENGQAMVREELSLEMGKRVLARTLEMAYAHKLGLQADG